MIDRALYKGPSCEISLLWILSPLVLLPTICPRERDLLAKSGFVNGKRQRSERASMLRMGVGEKGREMRLGRGGSSQRASVELS